MDVVDIFPYAKGNTRLKYDIPNVPDILAASVGSTDLTRSKAAEIVEKLRTLRRYEQLHIIQSCIDETLEFYWFKRMNITFLTYSGGGQIAYTAAQDLSGTVEVDNLVMMGSPYLAWNGVSNIGHLWELWGQADLDYPLLLIDEGGGMGGMGGRMYVWRMFNEGWSLEANPIYTGNGTEFQMKYSSERDIYLHGATRCILWDDKLGQGGFYGHGDYAGSEPDGGVTCSSANGLDLKGYNRPAKEGWTRLNAIENFLFDVVGVNRP